MTKRQVDCMHNESRGRTTDLLVPSRPKLRVRQDLYSLWPHECSSNSAVFTKRTQLVRPRIAYSELGK